MYSVEDFKNWLFIDIETVTITDSLDTLPEILGDNALSHWANKAKYQRQNNSALVDLSDAEIYDDWGVVHPEFGKVIVISVGQVKWEDGVPVPKIRSIYGHTEAEVLTEFMSMMQKIFTSNFNAQIVGHNIKRFDLPYILKRCIVNGVQIPAKLHLQKLKPWESCLLDTTEIWKFGDYAGGASLSLLCDLLQIPTPKENMQGNQVTGAYWKENRLKDIKDYCELDVVATMNLMLKFSQLPIIER
jgi:3'-5' exonuclease